MHCHEAAGKQRLNSPVISTYELHVHIHQVDYFAFPFVQDYLTMFFNTVIYIYYEVIHKRQLKIWNVHTQRPLTPHRN